MKPSREEIISFIERCVEERQSWACSEEGYKRLGPGSPTVPGMQEYTRILRYARNGDEREIDR